MKARYLNIFESTLIFYYFSVERKHISDAFANNIYRMFAIKRNSSKDHDNTLPIESIGIKI